MSLAACYSGIGVFSTNVRGRGKFYLDIEIVPPDLSVPHNMTNVVLHFRQLHSQSIRHDSHTLLTLRLSFF